jgi:hypothetical protein
MAENSCKFNSLCVNSIWVRLIKAGSFRGVTTSAYNVIIPDAERRKAACERKRGANPISIPLARAPAPNSRGCHAARKNPDMSNCWHPRWGCGALLVHTHRADPAGCGRTSARRRHERDVFPAPRRSLSLSFAPLCVSIYKCVRCRCGMDETTKVQRTPWRID